MTRRSLAKGIRQEGDITDAAAWLSLYGDAIKAGKLHHHAVRLADIGAREFKRRFPTAASVEAKKTAAAAQIEAAKAKKGGN